MKAVILFSVLIGLGHSYRPLKPQVHNRMPLEKIKSQPLYLTPYIESGNVEEGRQMAEVTKQLDGLSNGEQPESYSGFLTVDKSYDSNMFFWFVPATDVNPMSAPVVIWLQGGPGGSSLFGLLEIHGPFQATFDGNGNVHAEPNPYAWTKEANVIYIDNPVGAGFSYSDKLPSTEEEVENDLYEFLIQWFQLFPQYQRRSMMKILEQASKSIWQVWVLVMGLCPHQTVQFMLNTFTIWVWLMRLKEMNF